MDNTSGSDVVATLDVVTAYGANFLARREIRRNEFAAPNQWQTFTVEFNNPRFGLVEGRVYWHDTVNMKFNQLTINTVSTAAGGINWFVTDQLGTPRMVLDKTGTLASTKEFTGTSGQQSWEIKDMRLIDAAMYDCKKRSLGLTLLVMLAVTPALSCASHLSAEVPSQPRTTSSGAVEVQTLCDKLAEIKTLPHKDEPVNDPVYNALVRAGEKAIPCLIRKVTDTTSMRDPRKAPGYAGIDNKVGDVALWVLRNITDLDYVELLPPSVQEDYKEEGVFAYFKYVQNDENRKELQDKLNEWYRQKYGKDAAQQ